MDINLEAGALVGNIFQHRRGALAAATLCPEYLHKFGTPQTRFGAPLCGINGGWYRIRVLIVGHRSSINAPQREAVTAFCPVKARRPRPPVALLGNAPQREAMTAFSPSKRG